MNFKKQETSGPAAPSLAGDQARHIGRYGESMIRAYSRGKQSIALDLKSGGRRAAIARWQRS